MYPDSVFIAVKKVPTKKKKPNWDCPTKASPLPSVTSHPPPSILETGGLGLLPWLAEVWAWPLQGLSRRAGRRQLGHSGSSSEGHGKTRATRHYPPISLLEHGPWTAVLAGWTWAAAGWFQGLLAADRCSWWLLCCLPVLRSALPGTVSAVGERAGAGRWLGSY